MNYSQMVSYLKEKNKGKIVFVQSGVFYIAIAQDAVFLSNTLLLKTTCHKKDICKERILLRIMYKEHWMDNKKFMAAMEKLRRNRKNCRGTYKILWQEQ